MSWYHSMFKTLGIMAVAGSIVALGAEDLYREHARKTNGRTAEEAKRLLNQLRGSDLKARLKPDSPVVKERQQEIQEVKRSVDRLDQLGEEDKSALDSLISGISSSDGK